MDNSRDEKINRLNISAEIKRLRENSHVSQLQFYYETNINIARIESGKSDIRLQTLRKICFYFHISVIDFLIDSSTENYSLN